MKAQHWYMQIHGTEFGPIDTEQVRKVLTAGKMTDPIYLWKSGMENWTFVEDVTEFAGIYLSLSEDELAIRRKRAQAREAAKQNESVVFSREGRREPRKRMVAMVILLKPMAKRVLLGICLDVSSNGLRVLIESDEAKFATKDEVSLEITPISLYGMRPMRLRGQVSWFNKESQELGILIRELAERDREVLLQLQE